MENRFKVGQKLMAVSESAEVYGNIQLVEMVDSLRWKVITEGKDVKVFYESAISLHFKFIELEPATPEELEEAKTGLLKWLEGG